MLGVAAVMQPKADPTEHWSSTPKVTIVAEARVRNAGDGPELELPDGLEPVPPVDAAPRRTSWWGGRSRRRSRRR